MPDIHRRTGDSDRDIAMEALFRVDQLQKETGEKFTYLSMKLEQMKERNDKDNRQILLGVISTLLAVVGFLAANLFHLH